MGLNMTAAITMFAKAVVRQNKIPFEVTADPFYSEANIRVLEQRIANIESGKSTPKEHDLTEASKGILLIVSDIPNLFLGICQDGGAAGLMQKTTSYIKLMGILQQSFPAKVIIPINREK